MRRPSGTESAISWFKLYGTHTSARGPDVRLASKFGVTNGLKGLSGGLVGSLLECPKVRGGALPPREWIGCSSPA